MTFEPVRQEILLSATPDVVWRHLREPELVVQWHGWEDPGLEDEVRQLYVDNAVVEHEGTEVVLGGHRIRLEAVDTDDGPATVLHLTRTPPQGDHKDQLDWDAIYEDVDEGWATFLHTLQFRLDRHPDDLRRTGFWWGRTIDPYGPRPTRLLGLDLLDELQPGEPYEATLTTGDAVAGEVWFRTPHQVGITVDDWGDGLLVLAESPSLFPPHAASMMIANFYGLDDAAREPILQRLTATWASELTAELLPGET